MTNRQRIAAMELVQQLRNLAKSAPDDLREAIGDRCDQLDIVISPIYVKRPKYPRRRGSDTR